MDSKWRSTAALFLVMAVVAFSACMFCNRDENSTATGKRPEHWAQKVSSPHLKNFFRVSDDLYRGAQPEEEGMRELEKMGIKTVINLREWHSDDDELRGTGLRYVRFKLEAHDAPDEADIVGILKVMNDRDNLPVFVHCAHGSDRTGMVVAIYRIIFQGWDREEAIKEWTTGGFGYHSIFEDIVEYVKTADFEKLKKKAGIE